MFVFVNGDSEFIGGLDGTGELPVLIKQDARAFGDAGADGQAQFIRFIERESITCDFPVDARLGKRQLSVDSPGFVPDRDRAGIVRGVRADGVDAVGLRGIDDQIHVRIIQRNHVAEHRPVVCAAAGEVHGDCRFADLDAGGNIQVRSIADVSAEDRAVGEFNGIAFLQIRFFQYAAGRDEQGGNARRILFHADTSPGENGHAAERAAVCDSGIAAGFDDSVKRGAVVTGDHLAEHGRIFRGCTAVHIEPCLGVDERIDQGLTGINGCIRPPPVVRIPDDLAAGDYDIVECAERSISGKGDIVECCPGLEGDIFDRSIVVELEVAPGKDRNILNNGGVVDVQSGAGTDNDIRCTLVPVQCRLIAVGNGKGRKNKLFADRIDGAEFEIVHITALRQGDVLHYAVTGQIQSASGGDTNVGRRTAVGNIHAACGADKHIVRDSSVVNIESIASRNIRERNMVHRAAAGNINDTGMDDGIVHNAAFIDPEPAALHNRADSRCPGVSRSILIRRDDYPAERIGSKGYSCSTLEIDFAAVFHDVHSRCTTGNKQVSAIVDDGPAHGSSGIDIYPIFPSGIKNGNIVCRGAVGNMNPSIRIDNRAVHDAAVGNIDPSIRVDCRAIHNAAAGDIDTPKGGDCRAVHDAVALNQDHRGVFYSRIVHHAVFIYDRTVAARDRKSVQFIAFLKEAGLSPTVVHTRIAILVCHIRAVLRDDSTATPGIVLDCRDRSARCKQGSFFVDIDVIRRATRFNHRLCAGHDMQFDCGSALIDDRAVAGLNGKSADHIRLQDNPGVLCAIVNVRITVMHGHGRSVFGDDRSAPRGIKHIRGTAGLNSQDTAVVHINAVQNAAFVHDRAVAARDVQQNEQIRPADHTVGVSTIVDIGIPLQIRHIRTFVRVDAALPGVEYD